MNTATTKRWDVISPDGFSIHPTDTYSSMEEAKEKFKEWAKRYERQGYYSSNNGRIPLDELESYCQFVETDYVYEEET